MGIASAPDIFQSIMVDLFQDLDYVLVYIDDILILQSEGETEQDHLDKIDTVLSRLEDKGFRANLQKLFFMQQEIEYLGYLLTSESIKPQPKKVEAMKRIQPPKNAKQLKRFIGMINFYRDVWEKRSDILAPLSKLASTTSPKQWKWGTEQQKAFEQAKAMLEKEAVLAYPDFSKPFDLNTDSSDLQLGATLVQEGKPLGFYTRKLNSAQLNYTVGKKELLGIVEGFKAFEGILRGAYVTVHTNHLNLLYKKLPSQRMIRWRLLLEEFHPRVKHVAGVDNAAADALSRLNMCPKQDDVIDWEPKSKPLRYERDEANKHLVRNFISMTFEEIFENEESRETTFADVTARIDEEYLDMEFALDVRMFKTHQRNDSTLQQRIRKSNNNETSSYTYKEVEGEELIHFNNKIYVPETLRDHVLTWYHDILVHPGEQRMEQTIKAVYTWPNLRKDVIRFCKTCDLCQRCKKQKKRKYGLLPEKEPEVTKWSRVDVDLWGPKTVQNKNGWDYAIHVMTMVDPVTGWFELQQLYSEPTAFRCQQILDTEWLSRYPRPRELGCDNGGEFKGVFKQLCANMNLKMKTSLPWNPQSNAVLESIHQVLQDCLLTFELDDAEINEDDEDPFEEYLAAAAYAI